MEEKKTSSNGEPENNSPVVGKFIQHSGRVKSFVSSVIDYLPEDKFTRYLLIIFIVLVIGGGISVLVSKIQQKGPVEVPLDTPALDDQSPTPSPTDDSQDNSSQADTTPLTFATPSPSPTVTPVPSLSPTPTPTPTPDSNLTPDSGHSSISISPGNISADGNAQSSITVILNDNNNNPVSGQAITLTTATSAKGIVFTPSTTGSNVTDLAGHATFTVTSTTSGQYNIVVTATTPSGTSTTLSSLSNNGITFNSVATTTPSPSPTP